MCIPSLWSWMEGGRNWPSCRWRDQLSGRVSEHRHPAGRVRWAGDCEVRTANGAIESLREALTNGYHLLPRLPRTSPNYWKTQKVNSCRPPNKFPRQKSACGCSISIELKSAGICSPVIFSSTFVEGKFVRSYMQLRDAVSLCMSKHGLLLTVPFRSIRLLRRRDCSRVLPFRRKADGLREFRHLRRPLHPRWIERAATVEWPLQK